MKTLKENISSNLYSISIVSNTSQISIYLPIPENNNYSNGFPKKYDYVMINFGNTNTILPNVNIECLFNIKLTEENLNSEEKIETWQFTNCVLNNYKLAGNMIPTSSKPKHEGITTLPYDAKTNKYMKLIHNHTNHSLFGNTVSGLFLSKYIWDKSNAEQGKNNNYTFYCVGDYTTKITLKIVIKQPTIINFGLTCNSKTYDIYGNTTNLFENKPDTIRTKQIVLKYSSDAQNSNNYTKLKFLQYEIQNYKNKPIYLLMIKLQNNDGLQLCRISLSYNKISLSDSQLPALFYDSKIYVGTFYIPASINEYKVNYLQPSYIGNLYDGYYTYLTANTSTSGSKILCNNGKYTFSISKFTNIEQFVEPNQIPTTPDYQNLLLKLANKSKSGAPNPYYFNPTGGFQFNIVFKNNPGMIVTNIVDCEAIFTSIADGQQLIFDTCQIVYSKTAAPNQIQLSFSKQSKPDTLMVSTADYGKIAANISVTQRLDMALVCRTVDSYSTIGDFIIEPETGSSARDKLLKLINTNVNPIASKLTYTLNVAFQDATEQDLLSYEIGLASILARHENMQEYTYNTLGDITEEILNEKVGNIVAPMLAVDNRLNNMEQTLKKVNDAYFFNNLSNSQTNYRFFDTM